MITGKDDHSEDEKKPFWGILLLVTGAGLNLLSIFTDDSAALVAIGCSLIAVGAAASGKSKAKNH